MKKPKLQVAKPVTFPISLDEFLSNIKQPEMRKAFGACMIKEGKTVKDKVEWLGLLELFVNKPVGVPWETWRLQKGGNK